MIMKHKKFGLLAISVAGVAGIAIALSVHGSPPDAAAVLHADGYTQIATPGFTIADGHHSSTNGDGTLSEAIGVSTSNPDLYQEVQVYSAPVSQWATKLGGMLGTPGPGVTITTRGNAVIITAHTTGGGP